MRKKCAFFFDFDNTLYSHVTKSITENTKKALKELNSQGHKVVVATGRGMEAINLFRKELGFLPETLILMNGQIVYHGGKVVYEHHIALEELGKLFEKARQYGVSYGGYYRDGSVVNAVQERVRNVWEDFGAPLPTVCQNCEKEYQIYQAHLYIKESEKDLFGEEIEAYIPNWSHKYLVNLVHKTTGKSKGMQWCMQKWGIPRHEIYAFGDGFNDVDMIELAGHGIAVEGAFEALQEKVEYITKKPEEEGICLALKHYGFVSPDFI